MDSSAPLHSTPELKAEYKQSKGARSAREL